MLSHGVSQQQQGIVQLKKLAVLLVIFLGPKIGRSNSNSYKLEFSCVKVALGNGVGEDILKARV